MKLDVSSSGALAASLDKCIVSYRETQSLKQKLRFFLRIPKNLPSIPSSASWRRDACSLPNISALGVWAKTHSATTASRVRSIHISPVRFVVMLVSSFFRVSNDLPLNCREDVLAHRQLSAAIGYSPLHASLHSKPHVERVLDVVNRRYRMAQMAGRASVEFYVGLALKGRGEREKKISGEAAEVLEEAFVIRTFRNGVGVFVSK